MRHRRIIFFVLICINSFIYGDSKMYKDLEELQIGMQSKDIVEKFGEPTEYDIASNKINIIYKISEKEFYKLYFSYSHKLWKLCKYFEDQEFIIFMDTRIN